MRPRFITALGLKPQSRMRSNYSIYDKDVAPSLLTAF